MSRFFITLSIFFLALHLALLWMRPSIANAVLALVWLWSLHTWTLVRKREREDTPRPPLG